MADEVDRTQDAEEMHAAARAAEARRKAEAIPAGKPGECDLCGEWSERLVNGACAPCRDKYHLP